MKLLLPLLLAPTLLWANTVTIFKQWHLSPKQNTLVIAESKKLPQYQNQETIYLATKAMIAKGETQMVISEGCEGEITPEFKENFNGWDYGKLLVNQEKLDEILTLIPLKLEVLYKDKLLTLCGDQKTLINEHQLALSDLRAYFGYITRLEQTKGKDPKRFELYAKSLGAPQGTDPIFYARKKGKEALAKFKKLIIKRNDGFYELALKNQEKNPVIIIGGLHAEDLEKRLSEKKVSVKIITDATYEKEEKGLFDQLEKALGEK